MSGKLLDEPLANRHKALVFSQFVDHLRLILPYLDSRGERYQYMDGGIGLNLTAADCVIHMDACSHGQSGIESWDVRLVVWLGLWLCMASATHHRLADTNRHRLV